MVDLIIVKSKTDTSPKPLYQDVLLQYMLLFQVKRIRSCQGRFNYVVYYFYAKYLGRLDDAKQRKSGMT